MLGNMFPPKRRCVSSTLVGAVQYSLKMLGGSWLGILGFPNTDVSNLCACDPEGAVERSKVACEIHIVGTLYGHLLCRNLVNMLALLGPWPIKQHQWEKSSRTLVYLLCLGVV